MQYPVNETFYSLKGEGRWTGFPMFFIRLSRCNLHCEFCDTSHESHEMMDERDLLNLVSNYPTKKVVITGGEPLMHDLTPLLSALQREGYAVHLETNGSMKLRPHYRFAWIATSPKNVNFQAETINQANEVKILVGQEHWQTIATFVKVFARPDAYLYAMPLAKSWKEAGTERQMDNLIEENVLQAIRYCLANPRFGLCMQMHKVWGIK
jgi:organic radical activating enzyme